MCSVAGAAEPKKVTFLNPGNNADAFFGPLVRVMQAAADDLQIKLEVIDANRNHLELRRKGLELLKRQELPDYLLLINERDVIGPLIEEADKKGVRVFLFNERLSPDDYKRYGQPRTRLKNWLGEFMPNDRQSGYLLAKILIKQALDKGLHHQSGQLHMVAINGAFNTSSAQERLKGLEDALKEFPKVRLHQTVYAHWDEEKAYQVTAGLLKRYPQINVIWAASDGMAIGALRQLVDSGKKPGQDVLLGGVDWAAAGFEYVRSGELATTIGGHYLDGARSLVMLYDHHNGYDFRISGQSDFSAITKENIHAFEHYFGSGMGWDRIDFKKFTQTHRLHFAPYDFSLDAFIKQLEP